MVGTTGIEPVTTAMSRQCSTAELRAPKKTYPDKHSSGARKIPHAAYVSQQLLAEFLLGTGKFEITEKSGKLLTRQKYSFAVRLPRS